jgi:hypothetical protein
MALVLLGLLRIAATYDDLSETLDEVAHIGAGMEWLELGRYTFEPQHPPLARVAGAVGPYLLGIRVDGAPDMWTAGRRTLYADGRYLRNLTAARLGILPFFALAALFVWRLGREAFGPDVALGAVACFTLLPPVLAHFGVATTDGPFEAMFAATLYAMVRWLRQPTVRRGAWLGVAAGLALVTKFSALPYLGLTMAFATLIRLWSVRQQRRQALGFDSGDRASVEPEGQEGGVSWTWRGVATSLAVASVAAFVVAWASYRFSVGSIRGIPLPAPEIVRGIRDVAEHNRGGHPSYFLGEFHVTGVWYFFPVLLLIKTPLSALVLGVVGLGILARRGWQHADWIALVPIAVVAAILTVAIPSRINIGLRHVLPIYIALAFGAGVAWQYAWRRLRVAPARAALVVATALMAIGSVTIHPDYLAYFNVLAGRDPSRIVSDSDLDWGQDLFRLARVVREQKIDTLRFAHMFSGDVGPIVGVPVIPWGGPNRPTGWIAISETLYRFGRLTVRNDLYQRDAHANDWMDSAAVFTRVGKGIRLYHIPKPGAAPAVRP